MSEPIRRTAFHVYNLRCALTVEPSRNRADTVHTVNLETAARADGGRDFRWDAKLVVQVTGAELADVLATFLGHIPSVEFLHHGSRRDKGYRLFRDGARLVVQVFTTGERHTVSLERSDRLAVAAMLFRQLQRNHGGLAADVLHAMLERIYAEPSPTARTASADTSSVTPPPPPVEPSPPPSTATGEGFTSPPASSGSAPSSGDSDPYDW